MACDACTAAIKGACKHDYSVYQMPEGNRVAVNGVNAIVVSLSRGDFIGAGTWRFRATNWRGAHCYSRTEME
jgi:hypothetical protein